MLQEKYKGKDIILASGSPRRHELMKGLDLLFRIETKEVEEVYPKHLKQAQITDCLAQLKADAFEELLENQLVITADTIVWFEGRPMMKPVDRAEAIQMLKSMSGQKHDVYTSVCVKSKEKQQVFSDQTTVYFKAFDADEIAYYVETYKPYDKAGAYGIQEWLGYIGIQRLDGSYFNVMGFPVHKLYDVLKDF